MAMSLTQVDYHLAGTLFTRGFHWGHVYNTVIIKNKEYQFYFNRETRYYHVTRTRPSFFKGRKHKNHRDSASLIESQFNQQVARFMRMTPVPVVMLPARADREVDTHHHITAEQLGRVKGKHTMPQPRTQHIVFERSTSHQNSETESVAVYDTSASSRASDAPPPLQPIYDQVPIQQHLLPGDEQYIKMGSQQSLATGTSKPKNYQNVKFNQGSQQ